MHLSLNLNTFKYNYLTKSTTKSSADWQPGYLLSTVLVSGMWPGCMLIWFFSHMAALVGDLAGSYATSANCLLLLLLFFQTELLVTVCLFSQECLAKLTIACQQIIADNLTPTKVALGASSCNSTTISSTNTSSTSIGGESADTALSNAIAKAVNKQELMGFLCLFSFF